MRKIIMKVNGYRFRQERSQQKSILIEALKLQYKDPVAFSYIRSDRIIEYLKDLGLLKTFFSPVYNVNVAKDDLLAIETEGVLSVVTVLSVSNDVYTPTAKVKFLSDDSFIIPFETSTIDSGKLRFANPEEVYKALVDSTTDNEISTDFVIPSGIKLNNQQFIHKSTLIDLNELFAAFYANEPTKLVEGLEELKVEGVMIGNHQFKVEEIKKMYKTFRSYQNGNAQK